VPVGHRPDGPAVMIGKRVRDDRAGQVAPERPKPLDG